MKRRIIVSLAIALLLIATLALPVAAADEGSVDAFVTVTSYISITITDAGTAGIHFGSLAPGTSDNPDTDAYDIMPSANITVDSGSTVSVDLQIRGNDFNASTFPVSNAKYSNTYSGAKTAMSTSYADFALDVAPGESAGVWHWLDVPASGVVGDYDSIFSYKAVPHS
jgi:hypothetical protein